MEALQRRELLYKVKDKPRKVESPIRCIAWELTFAFMCLVFVIVSTNRVIVSSISCEGHKEYSNQKFIDDLCYSELTYFHQVKYLSVTYE